MGKKSLVLEIKGNSLDDGPGIRSVIFLKGCPLDCGWCHNPESKNKKVEISFDSKECIYCNNCIRACNRRALSRENQFFIDRLKCNLCFKCTDECPTGAIKKIGTFMNSDAIVEEVIKYKPFYDTSLGGVTISGGEPTLYMDSLKELLIKLKEKDIHILLETSGFFQYDIFYTNIYPYIDQIFFDIKIYDSDTHKKYCGVTNNGILDNFSKLYKLYLEGGVEILPRIPLIPNITDKEDNLASIAAYLNQNGVRAVALLPYNPLWHEKNRKIGRHNSYSKRSEMNEWIKPSRIEQCKQIFKDFEIIVG